MTSSVTYKLAFLCVHPSRSERCTSPGRGVTLISCIGRFTATFTRRQAKRYASCRWSWRANLFQKYFAPHCTSNGCLLLVYYNEMRWPRSANVIAGGVKIEMWNDFNFNECGQIERDQLLFFALWYFSNKIYVTGMQWSLEFHLTCILCTSLNPTYPSVIWSSAAFQKRDSRHQ